MKSSVCRPRLTIAAVGSLLLSGLLSPPLAADAIDDYVTAQLAAGKIPGVALLVMQDGVVVKEQGYGYANLEHKVPVTPQTIFQSASTGKQFTAAGILLLAEDGKLGLDDSLARHFPGAPPSWQHITVRNLLTHTSGLKDYDDEFDYRRDYTDEELLAIMQKLPLEFEPGTQWSYSNSGYLILGLLTTRLAGKHWGDFQAERLFIPLGMKTARMIDEAELVPHRAAGYEVNDKGEVVNQQWISPTFYRCADGSLYFSIRDLAAWEKALETGTFLKPASLAAWWTPVRLANGTNYPYGFGWSLSEQRGQAVIEHSGSWAGFRAMISRYPEQRLAVMVLANSAIAEAGTMAHVIAGLVDERLRERPSSAAPKPADDAALAATLRGVLEAWGSSRASPAMSQALAETASGSASEAADRRETAEWLRTARSFHLLGTDELSAAAIALLADGSVRAVDAVLETEQHSVRYRFRIDAQGRVVGFSGKAD
jgi:CubicO group peptidase (beta-lactamase class C family)